jgi:secernin
MCDTLVVMPQQTATKQLILAKNSDREPNEPQGIVHYPRKINISFPKVQCTYIEIPQVPQSFEVILSKPAWMWGAEMGVNEFGLTIGNEAVFTKVPFEKKNKGLTGMDMVRLALERCESASKALECIIQLLHDHGQDVSGGYQNKRFFYHNSFLIADYHEAWVLETAGKEWAAQRVRHSRSISNGLSIGEDYDLLSPNAIEFSRRKGWVKHGQTFHFAEAFRDPLMHRLSNCETRRSRTQTDSQKLGFSAAEAFQSLASHGSKSDFSPHQSSTQQVCMHASSLLNPNSTTASMVACISANIKESTIWLTGSSHPCLSFFKPMYLGSEAGVFQGYDPALQPDQSFWWRIEKLNRAAQRNYPEAHAQLRKIWDPYQAFLLEKDQELSQIDSPEKRKSLSLEAFRYHQEIAAEYTTIFSKQKKKYFAPWYDTYWWYQNQRLIWK